MIRHALTSALLAVALAGCAVPADPTPVQSAQPGKAGAAPAKKKVFPIVLTARRTVGKPSVISSGGKLSCARVTVTNHTRKQVEINPLYFSLTDTTGEKHDASDALGDYEGQMATTQIAPGEHVTGVVCGAGRWTPRFVTMTNEILDSAARAEVS